MRIPLDRQSAIPLYQQIESYLRQGILSGSLAAATRLPASRQLARDLGVNRLTVENAYAELETDGLIYSRMGSGTYVLPPNPILPIPKGSPDAPWPLWQQSVGFQRRTPGKLLPGEALGQPAHRQVISFASGIGDAHLFPAEDFRKVLQAVMRRDGIAALDYGEPDGHAPLRETITHILASQGLQTRAENVLITAGSQQALSLVSQLLLKAGDVILVESPTYSGALDLFRALNFEVVGIPVDGQGMQVEALEKLLQQHHPKLIYTIPNFHNPTGTLATAEQRRGLLERAVVQQARVQEVPGLERQLLQLGVVVARQEARGLEFQQRGRHHKERGRDLEVEHLHPAQHREVVVGDPRQRDVVDIDLMPGDEVQQQVERSLEDLEPYPVLHVETLPRAGCRA